jgi:putative transposase
VRSPESNGVSEAFVKTLKRDYVRVSPVPDAEVHPHRTLGYRSPREFIARSTSEDLSGI